MIVVTRLNDSQFAVNPDLIERIHASPDTTLVLVDGAQFVVRESMDQVIGMIASYRAEIIRLARDLPTGTEAPRALGLVPGTGTTTTAAVPLRPGRQ
ncbi:hypothetical protein GCM10027403_37750 [Arthrobacter tecti]